MKTMKIYRMDPNKFPQERMTILRMYWGTLLLLCVASLVFITLRNLPLSSLWWLPIIAALLLYYMSNAIRNAQRLIDEYTLEWDGETLKQNTPGMPEMLLRAADISHLELTKRGLELSTTTHHNLLTIPDGLSESDLAELKEVLSKPVRSPIT